MVGNRIAYHKASMRVPTQNVGIHNITSTRREALVGDFGTWATIRSAHGRERFLRHKNPMFRRNDTEGEGESQTEEINYPWIMDN
jgi:hypothetical protein